ncbi:MAG: DUF2341 domain-containing protein, partial [Candidatus Hodarchaeota archaeon]
MAISKFYKCKKRKVKAQCLLLFFILFPLIFNSYLFNFFKIEISKNEDEIGKNSKDFYPNTSSSHPINAGNFEYYKNITIDHTKVSGTGNLIDFPVLVSIFDSDLHDEVQPDGDDIAFANNFQWLDHEVELFNQNHNATHAYLVAWVCIPILSPFKDTVIRMYYGNSYMEAQENPSRVWNNGYAGVLHLNEAGTGVFGEFKDSTANDNDGRGGGGFPSYVPSRISGNINYSQDFDGIDDYINCGVQSSLRITGDAITLEAWVYYAPSSYNMGILSKDGYNAGYRFLVSTGGNVIFQLTGNTYTLWSSGTINLGSWHHVVARYNGSSMSVYMDGIKDITETSRSGGIDPTNDPVWIGHGDNVIGETWSYPFHGRIDEARISNIARSDSWIKTEYVNQNDPDSFYSVGNPKSVYIPSIFDFQYFKEITIDHTKVSGTSNLIDFPILISIFDSDLHDNVQPDGDDIAFNNGTSWLYHEIEFFNQNYNSTHAQLIAWVRIPLLSPSTDIIIRMYYGNSTMKSQENVHGVWDSNYIGVWHLSETIGPVFDSTFNRYNGIVTGASSTSSSMIDGGYEFVRAETDYIEMPNTGNELQLTEFTVEVWMKTPDSSVPDDYYIVTQSLYYDTEAWAINICDDTGHSNEGRFTMKISGDQQIVYSNSEITGNEWHHLVGVRDSSQLLIYTDGSLANSQIDSKPGQFIQSSKNISIGSAITVDSEDFNGIIDEVRISKVARSNDWIATEFENQQDPNSFYSISSAI